MFEDSSEGREDGLHKQQHHPVSFSITVTYFGAGNMVTHPGCDMAGRLRAPRRGAAAAAGPAEAAYCGAAVRCRLVLRGGGDGAG